MKIRIGKLLPYSDGWFLENSLCILSKTNKELSSVLNQSNNWDPQFEFTYRGLVPMKGKPEPMKVWILTRKREGIENTEALQQQ
ncbi:hypothetical protein ACI65C_007065 [Semiaphis heraclei]